MGTRENILETSIKLFNENRATNVSTVQIANVLGISTGNLYYHFKNKEHIIRAIWEEGIVPKMDAIFREKEFRLSESGILQFFSKLAEYTYAYRFFYREVNALVFNDAVLQESYRNRALNLLEEIRSMMDAWIEIGIMKPCSEKEKKYISENAWTLGQTWITHVQMVKSELSLQELVFQEVMHIYYIVRPYFHDSANERIERLIRVTKCDFS